MSSPIEHTATLLDQDVENSSFQQPPARLNNDNDDSIIVKQDKNAQQTEIETQTETQTEINIWNNPVDAQKTDTAHSDELSPSPIPLTQPIISDDENTKASTIGSTERRNSNNSSSSSSGINKKKSIHENEDDFSHSIITADYKGQPVWQLKLEDGKNITLMKRKSDSNFIWSGLLSLIEKIDPSNKNIIVELEKNIIDEYQTNNSEDNDIWIPENKVSLFAKQYKIEKYINPLVIINTNIHDKPEQLFTKKRLNEDTFDGTNNNILGSPTKKSKKVNQIDTEDFNSNLGLDITSGNPNFPFTLKPLSVTDHIINEHSKVIISSLFLPFQTDVTLAQVLKNENALFNNIENEDDDNDIKSEDDDRNKENEKIDKEIETENNNNNNSNNKGSGVLNKEDINIDIPIDDNGQTALHLAATLGKVSLVKELIEKGSNRFRGDNDGQTALIRVVHATNCFELSCFDKLLDLLYPSIRLLDNKGRSILHHIALTCGLKGRYDASKYYLETLLEWVVKKGAKVTNDSSLTLNDSSLTLTNFIKEVVNKSDKYGNTCLNYATLAGNKYIVSQLLDICADPFKANKIGVTPGDWGIDVNNNIGVVNNTIQDIDHENEMKTNLLNKTTSIIENNNKDDLKNDKIKDSNDESSKIDHEKSFKESSTNSLNILDSIQSFISNLNSDFKQEMIEKSKQIDKLNPILKDKALQLSQKRKQFDELQKMVRIISKITNKIDNLNKAISEEETLFQKEIENSRINIDQNNCLGDFDADQPFTILPLYNNIEQIVENILEDKLQLLKEEKKEKNGKDMKITDLSLDKDNKEKKGNELEQDEDEEGEEEEELNELNNHNIVDILNSIDPESILPMIEGKLSEEEKESLLKNIPPSVVLDARIRAYKKNNELLISKMVNKRNSNKELESQFKRIIGLCIGTDTDNIDDRLLSSLLMSVETDPDPEIGQIKKVLKIVGDMDVEDKKFKESVKALGGEIQHEYSLIKGFSIKLPSIHATTLGKDEHVSTIEEDQEVKANSV
ncbi:transcriptional regulator swi6 [Pichia californica]|nr:transcriptional regulator swi6 [[Candida] californica]